MHNYTKHTVRKDKLRKLSFFVIAFLFCTSLWQLAAASWIQGKAIVAQQLLNNSWQDTLQSKTSAEHKPWSWADTWPVAKLIVPQHNITQIVLAGDSGHSLAFGPGYAFSSAEPNTGGTTIISGHRDTHFSFLKNLKRNEIIYLQTADKTLTYKIDDFKIVDSRKFLLQVEPDQATLILVTCYPFDAVTVGGTLRYLVFAKQESKA